MDFKDWLVMKIDYRSFTKKYNKPPKNQFPSGMRAYKGFAGTGKTLSMVHDTFELVEQFPDCVIFSNVHIKNLNNYHYYDTNKGLIEALRYSNGEKGVLIIIDEAHLYFQGKNGVPLSVLTAISQVRKDRRRMFISSQIWEDLPIQMRKQVKEICSCHTFFKKIQVNTLSNGESLTWDNRLSAYVANLMFRYTFKHNQQLYDSYDTYQKIITNQDLVQLPTSISTPDYIRAHSTLVKS